MRIENCSHKFKKEINVSNKRAIWKCIYCGLESEGYRGGRRKKKVKELKSKINKSGGKNENTNT